MKEKVFKKVLEEFKLLSGEKTKYDNWKSKPMCAYDSYGPIKTKVEFVLSCWGYVCLRLAGKDSNNVVYFGAVNNATQFRKLITERSKINFWDEIREADEDWNEEICRSLGLTSY
jgi:hypothetical protein